jgi:hypothetical protein
MKKLLVLGALALSTTLVLGACGKAESTTKAKDSAPASSQQTQKQDNQNKLTYKVDGKEKSVDATTQMLNQGFDIKTTNDFTVVKNQDGDFLKGTGNLEKAYIDISKADEIGNDDKVSSDLSANEVVLGHGATNFKVMDLNKYPELKGKYDTYKNSIGPADGNYKQYAFIKTSNKKVTTVAIYIPAEKVTNETDAEVEAMAASVITQ